LLCLWVGFFNRYNTKNTGVRTKTYLGIRHNRYHNTINCSELIGKDEWPPNSPDLNPLDYHVWGAMFERYKSFSTQPENIDELKKVLQLIWDQLPCIRLDQQSHIELPEETSGLCESWCWTLWTYAKMNYLSDFGICNNSQCFLTMKITSCCWLFHA